MARTIAVGEQDFSKIIEKNYFYVDKTDFIKEWWENGDTVTLITRPRRFGKTLTMRMVEQFFSIRYAGRKNLFENLSIFKEETYRTLQGTYPVLFLSFANVKADNYKEAREGIIQEIVDVYDQNAFLMNYVGLTDHEREVFYKVNENMSDMTAARSLLRLSGLLSKYYNKRVILLLDEYDTPMQEAYVNGYWEQLVGFIRGLFQAAFKTNPYLERGIMTGITRISKESIFSDLNNPVSATVTSRKYATAFGFTESEVRRALEEFQLSDQEAEVKRWYDGFTIGACNHIYNPWSITQFLDNREFKPYWANTSSNRLVTKLIRKSDIRTKLIMEDLLQGNSFYTVMDEEIIYADLDTKKSAMWSLLLSGGYLKVLQTVKNRRGKVEYELSLTNREVILIFDEMVTGWFSNNRLNYSDFSDALLSGDKKFMNEYLNAIAAETFSYFDTGVGLSEWKQPENFYHGFILGLIADLRGIYNVSSNRESGEGRYDVLLEPYDPQIDDGIILEFKVFHPNRDNSPEHTVQTAIRQIIDKKYAVSLNKRCDLDRIRIYGFAFKGKEVLIDGGYLREFDRLK
ncbi:hypothetical protein C823_002396 [Eubacterium plexicaudatum ASF492]|uniref:AAA-ATPase-like domain-containing protein n=1 Tax=Eubacterium plexicaudatum ASF492 TaxID=1235802 RepID=N2BDB2_9FIRM|nr:hypothetical protein C823_002396 [Eubacterium plexicaudatum ASF492]